MTTLPTGLSPEALDRATRAEVARLRAREQIAAAADDTEPGIDDYFRAASAEVTRLYEAQALLTKALSVLKQHYVHDVPDIGRATFDVLRQLQAHVDAQTEAVDLEASDTTLEPDDDGGRLVQCWLYVTLEQARAHRA